tara:strand:+ start:842 stop:1513 length:672 start_codon:yes stop_codon:yes gene_type:complete
VLWIAIQESLFGEKLAFNLNARGVESQFISPEDLFTTNFNEGDIALVESPELTWMESILCLHLLSKKVQVIALGFLLPPQQVYQLHQLGVRAFVDENMELKDFISLTEKVRDTDVLYRENVQEVIDNFDAEELIHYSTNLLSNKEKQIVYWVCKDASSKEIAEKTANSPRTVDNIRYNLYKRIKVKGTAGLVKWAFDKGLVNPTLRNSFYKILLPESKREEQD